MGQPERVRARQLRVQTPALAAVAAVAALLAGCSESGPSAGPPARSASPSPLSQSDLGHPPPNAEFATGRAEPVCAPANLRVSVQKVSEATQQESRLLELFNAGRHPCDLDGYPLVMLRTSAGRWLGFTVRHSGDQMTTPARPRPVEVQAGHAAWVMINKTACVNRQRSAPAMTVRLQPPGSAHALVADIGRYPIIALCGPRDPGHGNLLQVTPVEPTPGAASAPL
jgi:hypothetical protein